jgi:hypothetical protein
MNMVFKFLFAAGFVFVQGTLRTVTVYAAWTVSLNDGIARIPALPRRLSQHT